MLMGSFNASAGDAAQLISVLVTNGTRIMPRTIFTQTWTIQNTGTTTWTPKEAGYTLNMVGTDYLGAMPLTANTNGSWYQVCAWINSGKSVAPGALATFSMSFIAPEIAGSYTDTFQLVNASSVAFGPDITVQITVPVKGSTNQYDRARAVSYANNYAGFVCSDGYYWTNGSDYPYYGPHTPVPDITGDDCAHFVSSCVGRQLSQWGGGLNIPSRVPPTYGEPGASRLVVTDLIAPGYAVEVSSLSSLSPGDVIGWNWEGDTNINDLDHVTFYLGNGLLASHANSALDVSATTYYGNYVRHLIHIYDSPTLTTTVSGTNMVLSWGTNWAGYNLYSSASLSPGATWSKVSKTPSKVGVLEILTNAMSQTATFYRLRNP
jgi:hypothetical protein